MPAKPTICLSNCSLVPSLYCSWAIPSKRQLHTISITIESFFSESFFSANESVGRSYAKPCELSSDAIIKRLRDTPAVLSAADLRRAPTLALPRESVRSANRHETCISFPHAARSVCRRRLLLFHMRRVRFADGAFSLRFHDSLLQNCTNFPVLPGALWNL